MNQNEGLARRALLVAMALDSIGAEVTELRVDRAGEVSFHTHNAQSAERAAARFGLTVDRDLGGTVLYVGSWAEVDVLMFAHVAAVRAVA